VFQNDKKRKKERKKERKKKKENLAHALLAT
jgi:hypothetical protein